MSNFNISVPSGKSKLLLTGGKFCPEDILVTAEGGGAVVPVSPKDVNFYDYDGTLLYAYTVEEAQALTELPPLPERDGLICQGWNWTLEGVNGLDRPMDVGATYITDDGATRLKIRITAKERMDVPLYFYQSVSEGVVIRWGDGDSEIVSGTGNVNTLHTYKDVGDYTIKLMPEDNCELRLGVNSANTVIGNGTTARAYNAMLREVYVGKNVKLFQSYVFTNCHNLGVCTVPIGAVFDGSFVFQGTNIRCFIYPHGSTTTGNTDFFREDDALCVVSLAETITSYGVGTFRYGRGLNTVQFPNGMTSIPKNFLNENRSLVSLILPSTVTDIQDSAFANAYSFKVLDCTRCTAVPTLANANAFQNVPADFTVLVPASLYDEWIAATNWAAYASYMQEAGNGGNEYTEVLIEGTEYMELTTGEWEDVPYASVSEEISIDQTTGEITLTGDTLQSNVFLYDYLAANSEDLDGMGYSFEYHGSGCYIDLSTCTVVLSDSVTQPSSIIKLPNGCMWSFDGVVSVYLDPGAYAWVTAEKGV